MSPAPRQPHTRPGGRDDPSTARLRLLFFAAVDEIRPEASEELVNQVYPVFSPLADAMEAEGQDELWVLSWRETGERSVTPRTAMEKRDFSSTDPLAGLRNELEGGLDPVDELTPKLREDLRAALVKWATRLNLQRDEWVLDQAVQLLQEYRIRLEEDSETEPLPLGTHVGFLSYESPSLSVARPPRYRPELETRSEYMGRIRKYMDRVEKAARDAGWKPARWKTHATLHSTWLARFQVGGQSAQEISRKAKCDQRTVEVAIKEMSDLIGLTRRRR